jgi:hypothetical protein
MNVTEQVEYETRVRPRFAGIAFAAGIFLVLSTLIQLSGTHTNVDELTLDLITAHKRFPLDLIGACIDAVGLAGVAVTLNFLNGTTQARNPQVRPFIRWLAVVGAGLSGVMAVAYAIVIAIKAHDFVTTGNQTYVQADRLTTGGLIVALPLLAQLGSLLLTGGFIWISLNALRVGLVNRWLGYVGVVAGALVLFPIGTFVPIVQGGWFVAMALLFAGRLPSGTPPAWASGVAMPWDPLGEPRQPRGAAPPRERPSRRRGPAPEPVAVVEAPEEDSGARTRANTPKRKRKRRN